MTLLETNGKAHLELADMEDADRAKYGFPEYRANKLFLGPCDTELFLGPCACLSSVVCGL